MSTDIESDDTSCLLCGHMRVRHRIKADARAECFACDCPKFTPKPSEEWCRACQHSRRNHALSGACLFKEAGASNRCACLEFAGLKLKRSTLSKLERLVVLARVHGPLIGEDVKTALSLQANIEGDPLFLAARALIEFEDA